MIDIPNANHSDRKPVPLDTLVLHGHAEWVIDDDGRIWHCTDWLRNIGLSCHAWCLPDGRIVREVDSWKKAYHAASWNSRSIGMEFVVPGVWTHGELHGAWKSGEPELYSELQYEAGLEWFVARAREHGIPRIASSVRTHRSIDPGNKADPGEQFPLDRFIADFTR